MEAVSTMTPEEIEDWKREVEDGTLFYDWPAYVYPEAEHGKLVRYQNGCRCELCKATKSAYMKNWYRKNRERILARREYLAELDRRLAG